MRIRPTATIAPGAYATVALASLAALTAIVLSGAAVRLSGSGLGCPDWPKCYGGVVAPLETHAVIEYGNRVASALVGVVALAAAVLAWRRRPFRRDLALVAVLPVLGVVGQAVLGGFTVRHHLAPGFVMAHYSLSMVILVAAVALAWRARHEPGARPRARDHVAVWAVRALIPLGALAIFAGTAASAAGPHAGGAGTGDVISRLDFKGERTLDWVIGQHGRAGTVLGVAALAVLVLLHRRAATPALRRALTVLVSLIGLQGAVGLLQYELALPAELVWIHVSVASLAWVALLWAVAVAGRLETARPA